MISAFVLTCRDLCHSGSGASGQCREARPKEGEQVKYEAEIRNALERLRAEALTDFARRKWNTQLLVLGAGRLTIRTLEITVDTIEAYYKRLPQITEAEETETRRALADLHAAIDALDDLRNLLYE